MSNLTVVILDGFETTPQSMEFQDYLIPYPQCYRYIKFASLLEKTSSAVV